MSLLLEALPCTAVYVVIVVPFVLLKYTERFKDFMCEGLPVIDGIGEGTDPAFACLCTTVELL